MKSFINETIASLKDKTYGRVIITKTIKECFIHWLKIALVFSAFYLAMAIVTAVYEIPQLPKIAKSNFPNGEILLQDGHLSSTLEQKTLLQTSDFTVTVDPSAKITDPDSIPFGVLITSDKLYAKAPDEPVKTIELSKLPNLTLSKDSLAKYFSENQLKILGIALAAILIIGLIATIIYILTQAIGMVVWASVFFVVAKILRKPIEYRDMVKLVIYASVPWLLVANVVNITPNPIFYWLNLAMFTFFVFSWLTNLQSSQITKMPLKSEPKKLKLK